MKTLLIILTFLLVGSSIIHAKNTPLSGQSVMLNQRLELINKVDCLTTKLDKLKTDHITKMNKYAELIEEKDSGLKNLQKEYGNKIKELKIQNRKDREIFNNELEKQRVCSRNDQVEYSEEIKDINSGYLEEISEIKERYESLLNKSASDYQNRLSSQQVLYTDNISDLKDHFESKVKTLNSELADFKSHEKTIISKLQKRLGNIEKNQKLKTVKSIASKISNLKSSDTLKLPIAQEEHSYFYRLFQQIT